MGKRRISVWVDDEVYEDYKRLAVALKENTADVLRESLRAGLPSPDELVRDYQLPADLLTSTAGTARRGQGNGLRRVVRWVRGRVTR
jgi:hypothetical protein